jgi:hypothetical protein
MEKETEIVGQPLHRIERPRVTGRSRVDGPGDHVPIRARVFDQLPGGVVAPSAQIEDRGEVMLNRFGHGGCCISELR